VIGADGFTSVSKWAAASISFIHTLLSITTPSASVQIVASVTTGISIRAAVGVARSNRY
jgi:hypothetical protein